MDFNGSLYLVVQSSCCQFVSVATEKKRCDIETLLNSAIYENQFLFGLD